METVAFGLPEIRGDCGQYERGYLRQSLKLVASG